MGKRKKDVIFLEKKTIPAFSKHNQITRRAMLKASGSVVVAATTAPVLGSELGTPIIKVKNNGETSAEVIVNYASEQWAIKAEEFGANSKIKVKKTDGPIWRLEITHSEYPGTRLSANGILKIFTKPDGIWCISFEFRKLDLSAVISLYDWLTDYQEPSNLSRGSKYKKLFLFDVFSFPKKIRIGFSNNNQFYFEAINSSCHQADSTTCKETPKDLIIVGRHGMIHAVSRINISVDNLTEKTGESGILAPIKPTSDDKQSNIFSKIPSGPSTIIEPVSLFTLKEQEIFGKSKTPQFGLDVKETFYGQVRYYGKYNKNCFLAIKFVFSGLINPIRPKKVTDLSEWPHIPTSPCVYRLTHNEKEEFCQLSGQFPEIDTLTLKGHVRLTLAGNDPESINIVVRKNRLIKFDVQGQLKQAYVPMQDADYSRFDFRGKEISFRFKELNQADEAVSGFLYELADPPFFYGSLDNSVFEDDPKPDEDAVLRVHRAFDLLDLKYRFRDVFLCSKGKLTQLQELSKQSASNSNRPVIAVYFPPQHIAEKAFLKVSEGIDISNNREKAVPLGQHRVYSNEQNHQHIEIAKAPNSAKLKRNLMQARQQRDVDFSNIQKPQNDFKKINEINEILDHVVEARASGSTRIVFELPTLRDQSESRQNETILPLSFSVEGLTKWDNFNLKVASRAMSASATVEDQLKEAYGGENNANYKNISTKDKIAAIRDNLEPPKADETSIEFPYRLHLSPADDAIWHTPKDLTKERLGRGIPPFSVRLDAEQGGRSVRALWTDDFYPDQLKTSFFNDVKENRKLPHHTNCAPWLARDKNLICRTGLLNLKKDEIKWKYRMALDGRDRHELVFLSSIYGLPALLPVPSIDHQNALPKKDGTLLAHSTVVPVPIGFKAGKGEFGDEGVYVPQPLQRTNFELSAYGIIADLEGQWEPPSGFILKGDITPQWPALTVERWSHEAFQGRDISVEIVYKGFVCPFGHRCSVIKATERKFNDDPNHKGVPVAYLIQRFFIVVGEPVKTYPAIGQPFKGRAMPFSAVRIITTKSPDILDPFENKNKITEIEQANKIGASAFVPKTSINGKAEFVQFKWVGIYPDGRETEEMESPFVVVDNTLVHDAIGVKQTHAYYNSLVGEIDESIRTAKVFDQRIKYAPETKAGATEFRTKIWLMGIQARDLSEESEIVAANPDAAFVMDAVMEGADQPPFYPTFEKAQIEIQSLNTMNGMTQGYTDVSYDLHYLRYGFAPGRNDAEIFLTLLDIKSNYLKVENRSNASGGLATPNNRVSSISRLKGPVGGSNESVMPNTGTLLVKKSGAPKALLAASSSSNFSYELPASYSNQFDPLEYFGKALSQAKLFGIIPLKDVVQAASFVDGAPEMIENAVYTLFEFGEEFKDAVLKVIGLIEDSLRIVLNEFEINLKDFGETFRPPIDLTPEDVYPELYQSLLQLRAVLTEFKSLVENYDFKRQDRRQQEQNILRVTSEVANSGRNALKEIEKVIHKPTPAIVDQVIREANIVISGLKGGLKTVIDDLVYDAKHDLNRLIAKEFYSLLESQNNKFVFCESDVMYPLIVNAFTGYPSDESVNSPPCGTEARVVFDITNPEDRQHAQEAILYEVIGKPIIDGYLAAENLVTKVKDEAVSFEAQAKELPHQLLSIAESWINGILKIDQLLVLSEKLVVDPERVLVPLFKNAIIPIIHPVIENSDRIHNQVVALDRKLSDANDKLKDILASGRVPAQLRGQVQNSIATVASAHKSLSIALKEHEEIRGHIAKFVNHVSEYPDTPDKVKTYIKPLTTIFDNESQKLLVKFNGILSRLVTEKDQVFRRAHDTLEATINAAEIIGRLDDIEASQSGAAILALASPSPFQKDLREIYLGLTNIFLETSKLIDAVSKIQFNKINGDDFSASFKNIRNLSEVAKNNVDQFKDNIKSNADGISKGIMELKGELPIKAEEITPELRTTLTEKFNSLTNHTDKAISYVFGEERVLSGMVIQATTFTDNELNKLKDHVYPKLKPIILTPVEILISIDNLALSLFDKISSLVGNGANEFDIFKLFLSSEVVELFANDKNNKIRKKLEFERDELGKIKAKIESNVTNDQQEGAQRLSIIVNEWKIPDKKPAAILALDPIIQIIDIVLTGKVSDLIDLTGLERELKNALLQFIPNEISFDYDWGSHLDPFPSQNNQIFFINKSDGSNQGNLPKNLGELVKSHQEKVRKKGHPADDLIIAAKAGMRISDIDEPPKPFYAVESVIIKPTIHLFGSSFDIVTVHFDYLHFSADENGSDFEAKLKSGLDAVEFGDVLEYISSLTEAWLGELPSWLEPVLDPPGIRIKYGFPAFDLSIGPMSILNLSIGIEVEIPFTNRPLRCRLTCSSLNRPFLIAWFPYAGAGYCAIRTEATKIIGFELQLEFGAAVAYTFGPLKAFGLVSAGIYIEKTKGQALIIAGFVRALGEGSLAFFSIAVHIEVRVTGQGNNVKGEATFAYSFKVGFVKYRFKFTAAYDFEGSDSNKASSARGIAGLLLDDKNSNCDKFITVDVADRSSDSEWKEYISYFE